MEIIATIIFIVLYSTLALLYFLIPIFLYHCMCWCVIKFIALIALSIFNVDLGPHFWGIYIIAIITRFIFINYKK